MLENFRKRFFYIFSSAGLKYILRDLKIIIKFLRTKEFKLPFIERLKLIMKFYIVTLNIDCPHTQEDIISFVKIILSTPFVIKGNFVEAGCYKGGGTIKFSLATKLVNRQLIVFDSFEGIPENLEGSEKGLFGGSASFSEGDYCGTIDEVKKNVSKYGSVNSCRFIKGWFENTMPNFKEPIAGIYLDVDLESSTRTCLKYLYPLLQEGGYILSQDGHLPRIVRLFKNVKFWEIEIGFPRPKLISLGKKKLIIVQKKTNKSNI